MFLAKYGIEKILQDCLETPILYTILRVNRQYIHYMQPQSPILN